jgi:hypothetical protein
VEVDGEIRHGLRLMPSRLDEPADAAWTVALVAGRRGRISRLLAGLRAAPTERGSWWLNDGVTQVAALAGFLIAPDRRARVERERRAAGHAAANIALRRAAGAAATAPRPPAETR